MLSLVVHVVATAARQPVTIVSGACQLAHVLYPRIYLWILESYIQHTLSRVLSGVDPFSSSLLFFGLSFVSLEAVGAVVTLCLPPPFVAAAI